MNIKKLFFILVTTVLIAALAVGGTLYFKDRLPPSIGMTPDSGPVSASTEFTVTAKDPSGIREVTVTTKTSKGSTPLVHRSFSKDPQPTVTFSLDKAGLKNGDFEVIVSAVDSSLFNFGEGNAASKTFVLHFDTKKPRLNVLSMQHNITRGGVGAISYTINEAVSSNGVRVGDRFFPGYQLHSGEYVCLFAFPYDMTIDQFRPSLEATDLADNTRKRTFPFYAKDKTFRADVINLPDSFLQAKMPQFEDDYPDEPDLLSVYLKVNRETRVKNRASMLELGQHSLSEPQWKGSFLRLPNAANRARFADNRTYRYNGQDVDNQTHLGIDLASVKAAKVPAANAGRIVRTGFSGIYGENVVIDHGLGLMTLYAHLSQIDVEVGDDVKRGQIIGRTGATGLAGGDHLHYGVFVSGLAVQPIEWWDASWIKNNISDRVGH